MRLRGRRQANAQETRSSEFIVGAMMARTGTEGNNTPRAVERWRSLFRGAAGATASEYAVILALLILALMVSINVLGASVTGSFTDVNGNLAAVSRATAGGDSAGDSAGGGGKGKGKGEGGGRGGGQGRGGRGGGGNGFAFGRSGG